MSLKKMFGSFLVSLYIKGDQCCVKFNICDTYYKEKLWKCIEVFGVPSSFNLVLLKIVTKVELKMIIVKKCNYSQYEIVVSKVNEK